MTGTHIDVHHDVHAVRATWNPGLSASAKEYEVPAPASKAFNRGMQRKEWRAVTDTALAAFSEVVQMAEAQHQLTLGRVIPRRRRTNIV